MNYHYTRDDLLRAIEGVGIRSGDTVSLQVSLGRLGLPLGVERTYAALSDFAIDAFLEVLGPEGTLVVPTYTYSIGRGTVFEVETTPSSIGEFPEVFRRRRGVVRSRDPMMSSAALGPNAHAILRQISNQCYGVGSVFDNLTKKNAVICTLGLGMWWATFCHYIEKIADAPFRFDKLFRGLVRECGQETEEEWIYFAAPRVSNCASNSIALEKKANCRSLIRIASVGRSEIHAVFASDYLEFGVKELRKNPWLTAKGPPAAPEIIFKDESQWVAARPTESPRI